MKLFGPSGGEGRRRGGSPFAAVFVFALTAALAALTWKGFPSQGDPSEAKGLGKALAALPETYSPLVLSLAADGAKDYRVRLSFRDLEGKELSVVERVLPAGGLVLDCWLLDPSAQSRDEEAAAGLLVFPRRFRAVSEALDGGAALFDAYSRSGFPAIYAGLPDAAADAASRKALTDLFSRLVRAESAASSPPSLASLPQGVKGVVPLEILLADPVPGKAYELVVTRAGKVIFAGPGQR